MKYTINNFRILLVCFSLFAATFCFGQSADELLIKVENYKKRDSIKVELLIDYCVANTFSNTDKNLQFASTALTISNEINYSVGKIRALNCLGNYYYQQAIYDKAIIYYTKALSISEKSNDIKNIVIGKSNLANIYTRTKQPDKAIVLFKEADAELVKAGMENSQNRAALLTNIGGVYSSINKHKEAIEYHKKTLALCEKMKIPFGIAIASVNIGEELVLLREYKQAESFLLRAREISEKEGYANFLGQTYKNLGVVYWSHNHKNKAIVYLNKAIAVAEKINNQNDLFKSLQILQKYYAETNDFKNAYTTSLKVSEINQSINGVEKEKIITETNTKYETEKKEAQIKSLEKDKKIARLDSEKQRNLIFIIIFLFVSILSTIYILFNRYKIKKQNEFLKEKLIEAEKIIIAEKKVHQSELKAFKSQMNPHFFYNALNTVQSYILSNDKRLAISYLSKFSILTRAILEMTEKEYISIAEEIKTLELYLDIEKARFNEDFEFTIKTNNISNLDHIKIPSMFLQPYVENAVKHGLLHKDGTKKLDILFSIENEILSISIADNGIGRKKSGELNAIKNKNHKSFATEAMINRIDILNKTRSKPIQLVYTDNEKTFDQVSGTIVNIEIPL